MHRKSLDLFHSRQILVQHIFLSLGLPTVLLHALFDVASHPDRALSRCTLSSQYV
jgi:hypothetical protein